MNNFTKSNGKSYWQSITNLTCCSIGLKKMHLNSMRAFMFVMLFAFTLAPVLSQNGPLRTLDPINDCQPDLEVGDTVLPEEFEGLSDADIELLYGPQCDGDKFTLSWERLVTFMGGDDCDWLLDVELKVICTDEDDPNNPTTLFDVKFEFNGGDMDPPIINPKPENETVECGPDNEQQFADWLANNGGGVAVDDCSDVTWSYQIIDSADLCGNTGYWTVEFTATDACGNSASDVATFTIEDTTPPDVTPASDETVECDGNGNQEALNAWLANHGGATASDLCSDVVWSDDFNGLSDDCGETGSATVTFTATDDCGNSASTTATFTIEDTTAPEITEGAKDRLVECDGAGNAQELQEWLDSIGDGGAAADACSDVVWSNDFTGLSDDCGATGSATVTFTATDDCGNSASTTATFTIEDTVDPVIDVEAESVTVECDGSGNMKQLGLWLETYGGAQASDVCGGVYWGKPEFSGLSDDCGETGTGTATFTVYDECGNYASTTATFTIVDTTDPSITDAANTTVECDGNGNVDEFNAWLANNGGATASDVCSGVEWSNNIDDFKDECGETGIYTVTFTATDDCGNTASTTADFIIEDTVPPVVNPKPENMTVECGPNNEEEYYAWLESHGGASATDDCSGVEWSYVEGQWSDDCGETGSITVAFTASDDCGNTTTDSATFTIEDTTPPDVTPASDETVECDGNGNQEALNAWLANHGGATATDLCSDVVWSDDFNGLSDDCGATGSATVTFTATDDCGNSASTTATFTIEDTVDPVIDVEAESVTVECDGSGNMKQLGLWLETYGGAQASDVCGGVYWGKPEFSGLSDDCGETGTGTATFTVYDECGNYASTTATFTIVDTTDPSITDAANTTVECDGNGNVDEFNAWLANNGGATASDVCSGVEWSNNIDDFKDECGETGIYTVTFTATDDCGNSSSTTADFIIEDTVPPVVNPKPENMTVECGPNNEEEYYAWLESHGGASATDECSDVEWTYDEGQWSDDCGETGSITVAFTASDDCGNTTTDSATFTIEDTTPPVITEGAKDRIVECDGEGNAQELQEWLDSNGDGGAAEDLCSEVEWTNDFTGLSDDCGATGSATVTFTATDDCGNSASTTATFTIEDTLSPEVTPAVDETVECDPGSTGSCTYYIQLFDSFNDGWQGDLLDVLVNGEVVLDDIFLTDLFGTGNDPVPGEYDPIPFPVATGDAIITVYQVGAFSGEASWVVTDFAGNVAGEGDGSAPIDIVANCEGPSSDDLFEAWLANNGGATATDLCSDVTWSNDSQGLSDDCGNTGSATVTFTATDDCGNSESTTATFTIIDTTKPEFTYVPADLLLECDETAPDENATATDTCGSASVEYVDYYDHTPWAAANNGGDGNVDFGALPGGFTVTGSNTSTANYIQVAFTSVKAVNLTFDWDYSNTGIDNTFWDKVVYYVNGVETIVSETGAAVENGNVAVALATGDQFAIGIRNFGSDCCGAGVLALSNISFEESLVECPVTNCFIRQFTATDECGNTCTAEQLIVFQDTTPPVIDPKPEDETVECDGNGNLEELQAWLDSNGGASATDNCGDVTWSYSDPQFSDDCGLTGSATVTFTATDDCGNSSSETATFTIEDTTPPDVTPAENETVECDGNGNLDELQAWLDNNGGATATDICSEPITWTYSDPVFSDDCGLTGSATVTFTAKDDCGNSAETSATFTIEDTTPPVIDPKPADEVVECDGEGNLAELQAWLDSHGGADASDECSEPLTWTYTDPVFSDDCGLTGSATVTFTVKDDCGNSSEESATFTIEDTTPPVQIGDIPESVNDINDCADNDYVNNPPTEEMLAAFEDGCGEVEYELFTSPVGDDCGWSVIHIYTIKDECGNVLGDFKVLYSGMDEDAPVLSGVPDDVTVECDMVPDYEQNDGGVTALDDCAGDLEVDYNWNRVDGNCPNNYQIVRTWYAVDPCGNPVSDTQVITVQDTEAPELIDGNPYQEITNLEACKPDPEDDDFEQQLIDAGVPTIEQIEALYSDNCGDVVVTREINCNGDDCKWIMDVRFDISDDCFNETESLKFWYHGVDTTPPVQESCFDEVMTVYTEGGADCPADAGFSLNLYDEISVNDEWYAAGIAVSSLGSLYSCFSDNCTAVEDLVFRVVGIDTDNLDTTGICYNELVITFDVADVCGNEFKGFTCTFVVIDNTAPTFDDDGQLPPYEELVECGEDLPYYDVKASDNCDPDPMVQYSEEPCLQVDHDHAQYGQYCYVDCVKRVWTATDACGNSSSIYSYAFVVDTTAPVIDCAGGTLEVPVDLGEVEAEIYNDEDVFNYIINELLLPSISDSCLNWTPYGNVGYIYLGGDNNKIDFILWAEYGAYDDCYNDSGYCTSIWSVSFILPPVLSQSFTGMCEKTIDLETGDTVEETECEGQQAAPEEANAGKGVELDFTAYPVPFDREVNIKYNFEFSTDVTIQVFDTKGLLILTETHRNYKKDSNAVTKLDLSRGGDQVFYVTVTTNRGTITKKIVSNTMNKR